MCCATAALAKTPGGVAGAGLGGLCGAGSKGGKESASDAQTTGK